MGIVVLGVLVLAAVVRAFVPVLPCVVDVGRSLLVGSVLNGIMTVGTRFTLSTIAGSAVLLIHKLSS